MMRIPETYRWKITAAGAFLLAAWFVVTVLVPRIGRLADSYTYLQEQQAKIASAENWEQKLAGYARQEKQLAALFSDLSVSMSDSDRISTIVEVVFNRAETAGVRIRQMRPLKRTHTEAYTAIPVSVRIEGPFHNLASFANSLEQAPLLIRLDRLSIRTPSEPAGVVSPVLTADLVINVAAIHSEEHPEVTHDR